MAFCRNIIRLVASIIVLSGGSSNAYDVPPCVKRCLRSATSPCNPYSLPIFLTCVDDRCTLPTTSRPRSTNLSISLAPKTEYSCQNSLLPGSADNTSEMLTLYGDGGCVNSIDEFRSFVTPGLGPREREERCQLEIFQEQDCVGRGDVMDSLALRAGGCAFVGGKSAKFLCGQERSNGLDSYAALAASLCANATVSLSNSSSTSGVDLPQGSTVTANRTATASGGPLSSSTFCPSGAPFIPIPGGASAEKHVQRSAVALVGVIIFAVVLL